MRRLCFLVWLFLILGTFQLAQAAPALTLYPASGPPTQQLTVVGSGFGPYEPVDVYFDVTDLCLVMANDTGGFICSLKVPREAIPGTNWSQFHYGPQHRGFNPYENVLSSSNVQQLNRAWSYPTGALIQSSPAVANGVVFVGSFDKTLYAYSLDPEGVYGTTLRRPDPAQLIPDLRLRPQVGW